MHKSVTIDIWETIIGESNFSSFSKTRREIKTRYAHEYLLNFSNKIDFSKVAIAHDFVTDSINKFSRFHSDRLFYDWLVIFINMIDKKLLNKLNLDEIISLGNELDKAFLESPPEIFDGTYELLDFCKTKNLKIGIISNTGFNSPKVYRDFFSKNDLFYDTISLSNELGTAKPHSRIFLDTLKNLNTYPENAIHIGDNPVADILGAINVGMEAILISKNNSKKPINQKHRAIIDNISFSKDIVSSWI
jgi:putative hydrolase of the HAD superfamily